jgi:hypothetical protein
MTSLAYSQSSLKYANRCEYDWIAVGQMILERNVLRLDLERTDEGEVAHP